MEPASSRVRPAGSLREACKGADALGRVPSRTIDTGQPCCSEDTSCDFKYTACSLPAVRSGRKWDVERFRYRHLLLLSLQAPSKVAALAVCKRRLRCPHAPCAPSSTAIWCLETQVLCHGQLSVKDIVLRGVRLSTCLHLA